MKITEYRAKKIILGDAYRGVSLLASSLKKDSIPARGTWVVKVDEGIKKRAKQGLVAIGKRDAVARALSQWKKKGYSQFLIEPFIKHAKESERYLSLERVRDGVRVLYAVEGGIEIESHRDDVLVNTIRTPHDIDALARSTKIPRAFLVSLFAAFDENFLAFLEINPLVVQGDIAIPLDAAVLVDSAASHFTKQWHEEDLVRARSKHPSERRINELAATTPASLALSVLNRNGSLFLLLSGGGGSIVVSDAAAAMNAGHLMANYGEYSGGPSRQETYLYAKEVLRLMLASRAKKKALVIAGGVANFTDVKETFKGIVDALSEITPKLRQGKAKVFIRRGGPNEQAGLEIMRAFLEKEKLLGAIYGSETVITRAVTDAIAFVK